MENKLLNNYLKKGSVIKIIITKLLICLIIIFISLIFINKNEKNKMLYKKYVFDNTFDFMSFKSFYEKIGGKKMISNVMVSKELLDYKDIANYNDGQKLVFEKETIIKTISSGIVVFIGKKETYGNTIIIQGSDGYDIWYGNIDNSDLKLYDYVENNTIVGTVNKELYLLISKDNKYIKYEDYKDK